MVLMILTFCHNGNKMKKKKMAKKAAKKTKSKNKKVSSIKIKQFEDIYKIINKLQTGQKTELTFEVFKQQELNIPVFKNLLKDSKIKFQQKKLANKSTIKCFSTVNLMKQKTIQQLKKEVNQEIKKILKIIEK